MTTDPLSPFTESANEKAYIKFIELWAVDPEGNLTREAEIPVVQRTKRTSDDQPYHLVITQQPDGTCTVDVLKALLVESVDS